ncbi:hypothetical protein GCM10010441_39230 [Kitasatospora paracochleata]|uniref:Flp family type IVb pilin n=1 Tax=Kitasatospora paracochleata TaxID=58354 RepID=A0ABT1J929_9ACTN|nr:hypothetical protein [Kitasatospora paracochleata]MCP2313960.1 hypothetical protein [Kitasatospora paracochleata]
MSVTVIEAHTERPTPKPLTQRLAAAKAGRKGKRGDAGLSAVEFLGFALLAIVIVGIVGFGVKQAITTKTNDVGTCITTSDSTQNGTGTGCK